MGVLVLVVLGVQADKDWKIFMNWAKTKAMESYWGEENMKLHTLNMKKAVAKCMDEDAPELDLPPFRVMDRLVNNLVSSADENEDMMKMMKFMMMMKATMRDMVAMDIMTARKSIVTDSMSSHT